jgi:hypothetical protein
VTAFESSEACLVLTTERVGFEPTRAFARQFSSLDGGYVTSL